MYNNLDSDLQSLNANLRLHRDVRKTLWKQPNILKLQARMQQRETVLLDIQEETPGSTEESVGAGAVDKKKDL